MSDERERLVRRVEETEHLADHTELRHCPKCVALTDLHQHDATLAAYSAAHPPTPGTEEGR